MDKETGILKVYHDMHITAFEWTTGNWSCDCNRMIAFLGVGESLDFSKTCETFRYLVVDAEGDFGGTTKEEFIADCNTGYTK